MLVSATIVADFVHREPILVYATQNDSNTRELRIIPKGGDSLINIEEVSSVALGYKKPDGTYGLYDTLPNGKPAYQIVKFDSSDPSEESPVWEIRLSLAPQVLACSGVVEACLALFNPAGDRLSTFPFTIWVEEDPSSASGISNNYYYLSSWESVNSAIGNLSELQTYDQSSIVAAINEVLSTAGTGGGGSVGGTDLRLDTTLTRPGYAADARAVGDALKDLVNTVLSDKLDASELPEAINTALAQAKANGEFDGEDGKTPVRGVDYGTPADLAVIIQQVIDALGGVPVFGTVDPNNTIVLSGALAEGEYTVKYENADGTVVEIGTINLVAEPEPAYTNLADPTDPAWVIGKRYNSSGVLTDAPGCVISNYIDVSSCTSHIAVKGINLKEGNGRIYLYNTEADAPVSFHNTVTSDHVTVADYDSSVYIVPASMIFSTKLWRFGGTLVGTSEDVVIAIDEDIK